MGFGSFFSALGDLGRAVTSVFKPIGEVSRFLGEPSGWVGDIIQGVAGPNAVSNLLKTREAKMMVGTGPPGGTAAFVQDMDELLSPPDEPTGGTPRDLTIPEDQLKPPERRPSRTIFAGGLEAPRSQRKYLLGA